MDLKSNKLIYLGALALLLGVCLTYLLKPVTDADFFWHLATGQWIFDHRTIPLTDPFAFTSPVSPSPRQDLILGGYWLSQIVYYILYDTFGNAGIVMLRFLLTSVLVFGFVWSCTRNKLDGIVIFSLVSLMLTTILPMFALERPHAISFVLFLLSLIILNEFDCRRSSEKNPLVFGVILGLLFLFWSFFHQFYILGAAILFSYAVHALVRSERSSKNILSIMLVIVIPAVSLMVNGRSLFSFAYIIEIFSPKSKNVLFNFEQLSLFKYYSLFKNEMILLYFCICVISILVVFYLIVIKKYFLAILLFGVTLLSSLHVRYTPFLLIAFFYSVIQFRDFLEKTPVKIFLLGAAIVLSGYFVSDHFSNAKNYREYGLVSNEVFPIAASDHILSQSYPNETIFNDALSGGYLAWRLYPRHQIFVDGRTFSESAYIDSLGFAFGGDSWRVVTDKYSITLIILTRYGTGDKFDPLVAQIANDPAWSVAYSDEFSAVLKRSTVARR